MDYQFNVAAGDWSVNTNWSPNGVPTGGDRGQVNGGRVSTITTNFGTIGSRLADLNVAGNQYGAPAGNGTVTHVSGDVYTDWLRVGRGTGNTGTYNQQAGTVNANQFFVGGENDSATGFYNQSGGTLTVNSNFRVGHIDTASAGTSRGTFTLSGGSVTSGPNIDVGNRANGSGFAHGTFIVSNGTLTAPQLRAGISNGGGQAWGTINQTGGTIQITGNGFRHAQGGGTAVINLSGGTLNQPGGDTVYGEGGGGIATVNHSGTHTSNLNQMWVGYNGSRGTYNMNGGTINIASTSQDILNIGRAGAGTGVYNHNGGVLNATGGWTRVGAGATGTYNHTGGTSNLGSTWAATDGGSTAWIDISGGTANLGQIRIGQNGSTGTMVVHGGTTNSTYQELGWGSSGRLQMSSGTYNNNGAMTIGPVGGNATVTLSGGVLTNTGDFGLGRGHGQGGNSNGTFTMTGGTFNSTGNGNIGYKEGGGGTSRGTFNMQGGVANFAILNLGRDGASQGWMNHSGGTINFTSWLGLGTEANGSGTWNATGGVLNAGGIEMGPQPGSTGVMTVSGTAQINAASLLFSHHAPGASTLSRFNLEGGTVRTDTISILNHNGNEFNWGSGVLELNTAVGNTGGTDLSLGTANSPFVGVGRTLTVNKQGSTGVYGGAVTLATGSGINETGSDLLNASRLNLGGLYLSAGTRFNRMYLDQGVNLDASAAGDTLALDTVGVADTVYLLRPFGFFTEDYGSLPLIEFNGGGSMTGTFDTFIGLVDDGRGFSQFTGAFTGAAFLPLNTWYLQQSATGVTFHYKVAGFVPEPGTFGLLAAGAFGLRAMRRLRNLRDRMTASA